MATTILATKLHIPSPRPNVVPRPHLIGRLNEGLLQPPGVTLISAPAGFGKTTLASAWLAGWEGPIAWLSLDEGDNDPARLLAYLIAALQTIDADVGKGALGMLQSPQPASHEGVLTALLNELASLRGSLVLVLDDWHVIDTGPAGQILAFLIDHLPPQMHLVIATREDPDLPMARLRAGGRLTELRAVDLRFSLAEAARFFEQAMGLGLSAEQVGALETRTEGWVAGLQLAAISLQGREDITGFIESFTGSHRFVMDYLVEEVLLRQTESVQDFLLSTSLLDRLSAPLCEAVLPGLAPSGQGMLEGLERANLLIVPLDDRREWYRYHHLFAEVLRARLTAERPSQVTSLHRRASTWFERNGFRAEAIGHALAAREYERAADLIELEWSEKSGTYYQSATWLNWVKALPESLVRNRPRLSLGFAWELLHAGELEGAAEKMGHAHRLLEGAASSVGVEPGEAELRALRASLALAEAFHAQALGDAAGTVTHASRVLSLVSASNDTMRGLAGSLLGLAYWANGDLEAANRHMAEAVASVRKAGNLLYATSGTLVLAEITAAQGRLLDAIQIYEEALELISAQGESLLQGTADLHLGLSEIYRERGQAEAADRHLETSQELGRQATLDEWPLGLYLAQARLLEGQGDLDGALKRLEAAERLQTRSPVPEVRPVAASKARVWIRQGRLAEALEWARRRGLAPDDGLSYLREFEHVTLARLLIARYRTGRARGALQEARELLERLLKAAEEGGRMGSVVEILALKALAYQAQGDSMRALVPLERALTVAEPEGYVRTFVGEGKPMAELLRQLRDGVQGRALAGSVDEYLRRLLAAFDQEEGEKAASPGAPGLIEPLSPRELEVLELIAKGLSNQEISERLFVALSTVKGHNLRIFGKLQVRRRTEAVARARELGLLAPDR